ncbi:MAG: hypothetical protein R6U88_02950 [Candidatus Bipolaricaulota bacterium]
MAKRWFWFLGMLVLLGATASAHEVGAQLRLDEGGPSATGWVALSREWAGVEFSGRAEGDLLSVELRSLSGTARLQWDWVSARASVTDSAGGRTQVVSQLEAESSIPVDSVDLNIYGGTQGRMSWTTVGRSTALGTWVSLRGEALPWWGEGRVDVGWPWTAVRWSLAAGLEQASWMQVRVEGSELSLESAGLELGGESGRWSTSAHLTVLPSATQGITVRWGDDTFRIHTRLRLRSGGMWNAQVRATGRAGMWSWGAWIDLAPVGWQSTSVEVRLRL